MALPAVLLLWLAALLAPLAAAACPGRSLLTNATGLISTWNAKGQYRSHVHCEWIITGKRSSGSFGVKGSNAQNKEGIENVSFVSSKLNVRNWGIKFLLILAC